MSMQEAAIMPSRTESRRAGRSRASRVLLYAVVLGFGLIFAFPLYWALATSFKTETELYYWPPRFLPASISLANYAEVVTKYPFVDWFTNTTIITVLNVIGALQVFNIAYVATAGGPSYATWFFALHIYRNAFEYFYMGYGSALAWLFAIMLLVFTYIQMRISDRWVYYAGEK